MEIFAWVLLIVLVVVGLAGMILPGVPGTALILLGAIIHRLILPMYISWVVIVILGFGVALSWAIDFFGSTMGAKWGGASRWGILGAMAGAIIGIFFFPFGLVLGPLIGAFLGELIAARANLKQATRAGVGAGLGIAISTVLRGLLALILVCLLIFDCIF